MPMRPPALTSSSADKIHATLQTVSNEGEIRWLEERLTKFNIFNVLEISDFEIRHSNVLAWLLNPLGSHQLKDNFFKQWLSLVLNEAKPKQTQALSTADILRCNASPVQVQREWRNIDVLLRVCPAPQEEWVVCIENKINASQGDDQLSRYRRIVETESPHAKKLFIYLTLQGEEPDDPAYVVATHKQVAQALRKCIEAAGNALSPDQNVFLNHYLQTLSFKTEEESTMIPMARRLLERHASEFELLLNNRNEWLDDGNGGCEIIHPADTPISAISYVLQHRPGRERSVAAILRECISQSSEPFRFHLVSLKERRIVRFIPEEWNVLANRPDAEVPLVFCAINLVEEEPRLRFVASGNAPTELKNDLSILAASLEADGTTVRARPSAGFFAFRIFDLPRIDETIDDSDAAGLIWNRALSILWRDEIQRIVHETARSLLLVSSFR
jgi:hypothetical protein